MSETRRTVTIRLQVKDHEAVVKALQNAGTEGEKALKRIEAAAKPASGGLLAVNKASQEGQQLVQGYADRLGPVGRVLSAVGPAGMVAAAGVTALVAAGGGLLALAKNAADTGDALDEMSVRTGVSVENLSTLRLGLQQSGASLEDFTAGMRGLTNSAQAAIDPTSQQAKLFRLMGVEVTDTTGKVRSAYELFLDVTQGLGRFSSETERNAAAADLLGKSYQALLPFMDQGVESIKKGQEEVRKFGGEISAADAKLAGKFNDSLDVLGFRAKVAAERIGGGLVPALSAMLDMLGESPEQEQARKDLRFLEMTAAALNSGQTVGKYGQERLAKMVADLGAVRGALVDVDDADKIQLDTIRKREEAEKAAAKATEERAKALESLRKRAGGQKFDIELGALGGMSSKQLDELYAGVLDYNKIKPKIEMSGATAAEGFLLGYKQYFQTNETDFDTPTYDMAYTVADSFRNRLIGLLSESYQDLMTGDFEGAFKNLGLSTVGFIQQGFAEELAKQTVKSRFGVALSATIGEATSTAVGGVKTAVGGMFDAAFDMNNLRSIGSRAGGWLKEGVSGGFNWALPDISRAWASGGTIYTGIQEGAKSALMGAVIGAGIGKLMGDDITAQRTAIAGAIGGVLGSAIPGVGPILGSTIASALVGVVDKVFFEGARAKAEGRYRDVLTDVQAFGGIQGQGSSSGYFQRIGGFAGIRNDTATAILEGGYKSEFTDLFRTTLGATKEQAGGLVDVLRQVARVNNGEANDYMVRGISAELGAQIKNIMALAGFSAADIGKISFGTSAVEGVGGGSVVGVAPLGQIDLGIPTVTTPIVVPEVPIVPPPALPPVPPPVPPPPATPPPPPAGGGGMGALTQNEGLQIAKAILTKGLADGKLSRAALRSIGGATLQQAVTEMGGFWPTLGGALADVASASPSPHGEPFLRSRGIAIGAASGFSGMVTKPTLFVAGENHQPEMVDVIPSGASAAGRTGARTEIHFHIGSLQTLDLEATKRWFAGPAREEVLRMLYNESSMGRGVIFAKGVIG